MKVVADFYNSSERVILSMNSIAGKKWPDEPINRNQRFILRSLRDKGAMTCSALARDRHITRQYAKRIIKELERSGYVITKSNPVHRNAKLVEISASGYEYIYRYDSKADAFFMNLIGEYLQQKNSLFMIQHKRNICEILEDWLFTH